MEDKKLKYFGLSNWAIGNRMTVFLITVIILIGGLITYTSLPRESFPEVVENKIYVSTFWPGNAAEDVEKFVTKPLEEEIDDISGVINIESTSYQDYSMITVEFDEDITTDEARIRVKDKADLKKGEQDWPTLDGGAKVEPNVFDVNFSEFFPIAQLNLTGDYSRTQMKKFAEDLQERLEDFPEIKEANVLGVEDYEVEVAMDVYKMTAADVTFNDVVQAIQDENTTISGGEVVSHGLRRNIRVIGQITHPDQLNNVVVKNDEGAVFLRDIAEIRLRQKDATTYAREYGHPVVMLSLIKKGGENMLIAMDKVRAHLDEATGSYLPEDVDISVTSDQSVVVRTDVSDLENSVIFGVLLVIGVLMFFLGFRNALFVGIAIPLSILLAYLMLPIVGESLGLNITLNSMILYATVMGLGMLVDNGIVVVENVYRHMDEGVPRMEAARRGVGEIAWPIIASTGTTLAAFLPLAFWPGVMGKFMLYFPLTLGTVLFASLFVALVINAMLTSGYMKIDEKELSRKDLIKISLALLIFGVLLIISGITNTHIIFQVLGMITLLIALVMSFLGWKDRNKTRLLKRGLGLLVVGVLFTILGFVGGPGALRGFGNLFVFLAAMLWFFKYILVPVSHRFQHRTMPRLERAYKRFLGYALRGSHAYAFVFGTGGLLIVALIVFVLVPPKVLFFPENEPNQAIVYIEYPQGTDIEKTNALTKEVEAQVFSVLDKYQYEREGSPYNFMAESIISQVGEGAGNPYVDGASENEMPHRGKVTVMFREFKRRYDENGNKVSSADVLTEIREAVHGHPGVSITVEKDAVGPPVGYPINIELRGENYDELLNTAQGMRTFLNDQNIPGIEELTLDVNRNKPEMEVIVNRQKAGELGVSTAQVGQALRAAVYGIDASTYKEDKDDYDIYVRLDSNSRYDQQVLFNQNVIFRDNEGVLKKVPLSTLVETRNVASFSSIKRKNLKRVITVYSNVLQGYNATEIVQKMEGALANYPLPEDVSYRFTGEQEEMAANMAFLSRALMIAMALILLIIVAQFNSLSKPLMIFIAIVLSFIGVLLGMVIFRLDFVVMMTMMGIISLAGVVVNNGIVLIDYTQLLVDRKKLDLNLAEDEMLSREHFREAIIAAGSNRLRPVLLTALTTVIGLLPLATGFNFNFITLFTEFDPQIYIGGDSSIFWKPMSWTIIYGLTFATFLTLVIVPTMFYLYNRARIRFYEHDNGKENS